MKHLFIAMVMLTCLVPDTEGQLSARMNVVDGVVYMTGLGDFRDVHSPDATTLPMAVISEESWRNVFSVFTEEAFIRKLNQPVAGNYSLTSDGFSFTPLYAFAGGATYHAIFSASTFSQVTGHTPELSLPERSEFQFQIPGANVSSTFVEAIYPESSILPENMLRMYICFSGPMMPGEAYEHINLVNSNGEQIEKAFLVVDQELWDGTRTRFTILFDPGRIKRGLRANQEMGPPLRDGGQYSLMVDSLWSDVNGNHLERNVVKQFKVVAAERTRLTVDNTEVFAPVAGTLGPLVVRFDRPMDHAIVSKYVALRDALGSPISGEFLLDRDKILKFTPDNPWEAGNYFVSIDPMLEDVSGNNFKKAFDVDLENESRSDMNESIMLKVSIVPAGR